MQSNAVICNNIEGTAIESPARYLLKSVQLYFRQSKVQSTFKEDILLLFKGYNLTYPILLKFETSRALLPYYSSKHSWIGNGNRLYLKAYYGQKD